MTSVADRFKFITPVDLVDYRERAGELAEASWPEFMLHDPVAEKNWHELFDRFLEYQFALLDTENNRMAAMANSLPFYWDQALEGLPEGGWVARNTWVRSCGQRTRPVCRLLV